MNMNMKTPKECGYFMPAEWYPHSSCWMAWPCHEETWADIGLEKARQAYARVAQAIAESEPVKLLVNPQDISSAKMLCNDANIEFYLCPLNDSWTRDTGATFLLNRKQQLAGVNWIHNAWGENYSNYELDQEIATFMINKTAANYFHAPLVMEGGSFHTDGNGTLLTTRECLLNPNRNPNLNQATIESYLIQYLGIEKIIWLNQGLLDDETDGHIDEIACFIAPGKVLSLISSDRADPNYQRLHENLEILKTTSDAQGKRLEVYTIEQPPATYLHNNRLTLSYINFYLANDRIILPSFGYRKEDEQASLRFKQLFPHKKIIQIDARDIFAGGGGIHCITQQQPRSNHD